MTDKSTLRKAMRKIRREHAAAIPANVRALLFKRPPAPLVQLVPANAVVGLYHATRDEAPADAYARHFSEAGHDIALPRLADRSEPMVFARHTDPFGETDLQNGAFGLKQPVASAETLDPDVVFVPLVAFTGNGDRLGQGGGHYDRWLARHPGAIAIGLAWDCQLVDQLPVEQHDQKLSAVVTPTRFYGPF